MAKFALQNLNNNTRNYADPDDINHVLQSQQSASTANVGKERQAIVRFNTRIERKVALKTCEDKCGGSFKPHHRIDSTVPANMSPEDTEKYLKDFIVLVAAHAQRISGNAHKGFHVELTIDTAMDSFTVKR